MTRPKTPAQKVGEWQQVYRAVLDEMQHYVPVAGPAPIFGDSQLDRRTAAIVAAMLVGQNVRVPITETIAYGDGDDYQVTDVEKS